MIVLLKFISSRETKIRNPNYGAAPRMQLYITKFIGSRETNMEKFIKILEIIK